MQPGVAQAETRPLAGAAASAWTLADQAELDVLVWELVCGIFGHRERCFACQTGGRLCEGTRGPIERAVQAIDDWRRGRRLRTRAVGLRAAERGAAA